MTYRLKIPGQKTAFHAKKAVMIVKEAERLFLDGLLSSPDVTDIHHFIVVANPGDFLRKQNRYVVERIGDDHEPRS